MKRVATSTMNRTTSSSIADRTRSISTIGKRKQEKADLICLSHLRWNFVFQRPQHLLSRCARSRRVFFIEEPICDSITNQLSARMSDEGVMVVTPHVSPGLTEQALNEIQQLLLEEYFSSENIVDYLFWYYTPMALPFTRSFSPKAVIYDCMDELSHFAGAHRAMRDCESELMRRADAVFTGGQSLYEAKRNSHRNIHAFPSSIDREHFAKARMDLVQPIDQSTITGPRIGFFGVIDERLDVQLVDKIAEMKPDWQICLIGPFAKVDPAHLPARPNIHYLGKKEYAQLPYYLAGWDVAILPFAKNDSTKFISPTKTPEYLAGGKPVVSTSITDVVRPYGQLELVAIADTPDEFVRAIEAALEEGGKTEWLSRVDSFLEKNSWDITWEKMEREIENVLSASALDLSANDDDDVALTA